MDLSHLSNCCASRRTEATLLRVLTRSTVLTLARQSISSPEHLLFVLELSASFLSFLQEQSDRLALLATFDIAIFRCFVLLEDLDGFLRYRKQSHALARFDELLKRYLFDASFPLPPSASSTLVAFQTRLKEFEPAQSLSIILVEDPLLPIQQHLLHHLTNGDGSCWSRFLSSPSWHKLCRANLSRDDPIDRFARASLGQVHRRRLVQGWTSAGNGGLGSHGAHHRLEDVARARLRVQARLDEDPAQLVSVRVLC